MIKWWIFIYHLHVNQWGKRKTEDGDCKQEPREVNHSHNKRNRISALSSYSIIAFCIGFSKGIPLERCLWIIQLFIHLKNESISHKDKANTHALLLSIWDECKTNLELTSLKKVTNLLGNILQLLLSDKKRL